MSRVLELTLQMEEPLTGARRMASALYLLSESGMLDTHARAALCGIAETLMESVEDVEAIWREIYDQAAATKSAAPPVPVDVRQRTNARAPEPHDRG